jgi:hypothetical protein
MKKIFITTFLLVAALAGSSACYEKTYKIP